MQPPTLGRQNTMVYKDASGGGNAFEGNSIKIILPPKPGCEGDDYNSDCDQGESRMDVCALTLSSLAQDPNLPSSKLPFAWKLYEMLENVHQNDDTDIVSWVDGGKAFKVHDLTRFVEEIVPTYFKQSKYKSFQRQLYFYGFIREASSGTRGHTPGSYRHPKFIRGKKTFCLSMAPKKAKKKRGKSPVEGSSSKKKSAAKSEKKVSLEIPPQMSLTQHFASNTATFPSNDSNDLQSQFRQQQNQLQMLQMQGFLRSLDQGERQNLPASLHKQLAPQAPQLKPSVSQGQECNIFGGTFHVVGRKKTTENSENVIL